MLKLVVLSSGMTGRTCELKVDKTTVGRVDDNTFPIAEASVSSHHCEILLRSGEVIVHDLNSTNGTFISGEQITEKVLKPGQILRLGQVELRLEAEEAAAAAAAAKQHFDRTTVIAGGVKRSELEGHGTGLDKGAGFSRKTNRVNQIFLIVGLALGLVIVGLLLYIFTTLQHG